MQIKSEQCELDQRIWAVLSATMIVVSGLTYFECVNVLAGLVSAKPERGYELVITTNDAAKRFNQNL